MRGATVAVAVAVAVAHSQFQSTRPMRGATHIDEGDLYEALISIHAPHAGRDYHGPYARFLYYGFQSTRPMRGATWLHAAPL